MDKKILQEKLFKLHELQNTIKQSKKRNFDGFLRECEELGNKLPSIHWKAKLNPQWLNNVLGC